VEFAKRGIEEVRVIRELSPLKDTRIEGPE
jgi:hypothetical protein